MFSVAFLSDCDGSESIKEAEFFTEAETTDSGSAYLIVQVKVKDPHAWKHYSGSVGATLKPHGGQVVFKGKTSSVLAGEHAYSLGIVIKFLDQQAVTNWYLSKAYQAVIPTRTKAADVVMISYET